jgi:iron complex transport system substrate-binding protein
MVSKLLAFLLPALLLAAVAVACDDDEDEDGEGGAAVTTAAGASPTDEAETSADTFPLTITDDSGAEVTLEQEPERIVALAPSFVEVLFEIGAGDLVVAADENSDYPPEVAEIPKLSGFTPSVEAIVGYDPDLVLIQFDPGGLVESLEASDVSAVTLGTPESMEGVYDQIETIGRLSGYPGEADAVVSAMREEVADTVASLGEGMTEPRVYHEVDNTLFSVGPGSYIHDIYVILLAENIATESGSAFPQLSNEAIVAADPEVIILADEAFGESAETVAARPGWAQISAVENGRVHGVDPNLISRPGPRLPEVVDQIADYLYP